MRLAADQKLTGEEETAKRNSLLKSGLTVLGILLVIWVGMNAGRIMGMVVPGSETDSTGEAANAIPVHPAKFWEADGAPFEKMTEDLKGRFPTESEADTARLNPPSSSAPNGYFALFEKVGTAERFVGAGCAALEGEKVRFVAALNDGTELRGLATLAESAVATVDWHMSGLQREGKYYAGAGSAVPQADGAYQIIARSEIVPQVFQAVAYPMSAR